MTDESGLPLPPVRYLDNAAYLGIGVTLLLQLGPPPIKFGRRSVGRGWTGGLRTISAEGWPERSFDGLH